MAERMAVPIWTVPQPLQGQRFLNREARRAMLEDDFTDILRKAKRGTGTSDADLAARTGLAAADLADWAAGRRPPSDDEARATGPSASSPAKSPTWPHGVGSPR